MKCPDCKNYFRAEDEDYVSPMFPRHLVHIAIRLMNIVCADCLIRRTANLDFELENKL